MPTQQKLQMKLMIQRRTNWLCWCCMTSARSSWRHCQFSRRARRSGCVTCVVKFAVLHPCLATSRLLCAVTMSQLCKNCSRWSLGGDLNQDVQRRTSLLRRNAANGAVEQAIQSVRQQAQLLLHQYEDSARVKVPTMHPLRSWSWRHASWLLNRFNSTAGQSSYERAFNCAYTGDKFGESVFGRVCQQMRGQPRFVTGIWLGKLSSNDSHCMVTAGGSLVATRTI